MFRSWTFGRKIGAGFALAVFFLMVTGVASIFESRQLELTHRMTAVLEVAAHLLVLEEAGLVTRDTDSGVDGFTCP